MTLETYSFCIKSTFTAYSDLKIRLVNSKNDSNKTGGRVEIYHPSFGWGTVFDRTSPVTTSGVVCRQLGFRGGNIPEDPFYYGEGTGVVLLFLFACSGEEKYIWDCANIGGWNPRGITHHDYDIGVDCY